MGVRPAIAKDAFARARGASAMAWAARAIAGGVPAIAQAAPATAGSIPAIAETVPATSKPFLAIADTIPAIAKTISATAKTIPAIAETISPGIQPDDQPPPRNPRADFQGYPGRILVRMAPNPRFSDVWALAGLASPSAAISHP
jgi:hypothetical protein